jgi:nickel-dependent lactate racemase
MKISFHYRDMPSVDVPEKNLIGIYEPAAAPSGDDSGVEIVKQALLTPLGTERLSEMVQPESRILILVDDNTRTTPTDLIIPEVIEELCAGGAQDSNIRFMIALGTHRPMTMEEKVHKYGKAIVEKYEFLDHLWEDTENLVRLPDTENGTEIWLNRALFDADIVIGIGHITPHRVAGFSGGAKIIQPGVSGGITTGQTHWLSAFFSGEEIMGKVDNPVRREMNEVARAAGLSFIVNVILDKDENIYSCFCGDLEEAHRKGCEDARKVFGVYLDQPADIVIAESYPADLELWQAAKGLYAEDLAMKDGGISILVTPCREGVCFGHGDLAELGYHPLEVLKEMVDKGEVTDLTLAAHSVHGGGIIKERGRGILVSPGIDRETTEKLGFIWAATPQEALEKAFEIMGPDASVAVLRSAGDLLPIIR